ncbi:hypothetical protein BCV70DRAFT_161850 [Testicularia cyperi]|uniref:RecQ-mediated genome instability protein 1 n=1 Tax=Testicularia cyperi TaxID=1882483 RepID=A0A317XP30_9BASI|nr:hypothetical protein BCV70DRAFT_161850 [Testicularia cyperi]
MPAPVVDSIPAAVTRLLSARYPTLKVSTAWLSRCIQDLRSQDAALCTASEDQLAKAVRQALLDADLSDVVAPEYRQFGRPIEKMGEPGRGAVLLQIESMVDIGFSLSTQLDIAEARRDVRASLGADPLLDTGKLETEAKDVDDHMANFQAQEEENYQSTTVFPRRMLKLELSDGSEGGARRMVAVEIQRVPGLDMNTTPVGTKLLLKGAAMKKDYILLTPKDVQVEGGYVANKAKQGDEVFISKLRTKLGKPAQKAEATQGQGQPLIPQTETGVLTNESASADDDDDDESFLLAALDAEEEIIASQGPAPLSKQNAASKGSQAGSVVSRSQVTLPNRIKSSSSQSQSKPALTAQASNRTAPISLIDSDDEDEDKFFANLPEPDVVMQSIGSSSGESARPNISNTWNDPIVIESSPEP